MTITTSGSGTFISPPSLPASRPWTFWQHADNARLQGYTGREPCIDMNVFSGTPEEFAAYVGVPA